jgi:hypothetical protein
MTAMKPSRQIEPTGTEGNFRFRERMDPGR